MYICPHNAEPCRSVFNHAQTILKLKRMTSSGLLTNHVTSRRKLMTSNEFGNHKRFVWQQNCTQLIIQTHTCHKANAHEHTVTSTYTTHLYPHSYARMHARLALSLCLSPTYTHYMHRHARMHTHTHSRTPHTPTHHAPSTCI